MVLFALKFRVRVGLFLNVLKLVCYTDHATDDHLIFSVMKTRYVFFSAKPLVLMGLVTHMSRPEDGIF